MRLNLVLPASLFFASLAICCAHSTSENNKKEALSLDIKLSELETRAKGRLGVFAIHERTGEEIRFRSEERFPMCSTAKAIIVGAILKKSMNERSFLKKHIAYTRKDLEGVGHAPITRKNVVHGMTVGELAAATMQFSDNAAANLLLKELNGPPEVTTFARSMGDRIFELVRWEPDLNSALPGDTRDTSSPEAMAKSLRQLAFGEVLADEQRSLFIDFLKGNTTGGSRIRAGAPSGWTVGDKTGTCAFGTTNDIGIVWHPNGAPVIVTIYFTQDSPTSPPRDDVIAAATKYVLSKFH